jgi:hypothetical protein
MTTDPALLVGIGTGSASLLSAVYLNRRKINELASWAWGRERDETDDGVSGQARSLQGSLNHLEDKIDEQHATVRGEVQENRRYFRVAMENLTDELDEQLPEVDLDVDDVEPRWADGGRPRDDRDD